MNEHTVPDPRTSPEPDGHTLAPTLPEPGDVITALGEWLPGGADDLLVVVYASSGLLLARRRDREREESADLRAVGEDLAHLLDHVEGQDAYLVAYTGSHSVAVLQDIAAAEHPSLQAVLRVHEGRWWKHSSGAGPLGAGDPGTEGRPVSSEPAGVAAAVSTVLGARYESGFAAHLRPGPDRLQAQVRQHLSAHLRTGGAHQQRAAAALLRMLEAERRARSHGPVRLEPGRAAHLLLALTNQDVWEHVLLWHDAGTRSLWRDLIRHAPGGWIRPVATLAATTALHCDLPQEARSAAALALGDEPDPTRQRHDGELDLAEAVLTLVGLQANSGHFHAFVLGYLWPCGSHDLPGLLGDDLLPDPPSQA